VGLGSIKEICALKFFPFLGILDVVGFESGGFGDWEVGVYEEGAVVDVKLCFVSEER